MMEFTFTLMLDADDQKNIVVFTSDIEHGVAMDSAPSWNIFERSRVCSENLENCSGSQLFDPLLRANDGKWAK